MGSCLREVERERSGGEAIVESLNGAVNVVWIMVRERNRRDLVSGVRGG